MSRKKTGRTENQGAPRLGFNAYNISRERYIDQVEKLEYGDYSFMIPASAAGGDIYFHRDIAIERKSFHTVTKQSLHLLPLWQA